MLIKKITKMLFSKKCDYVWIESDGSARELTKEELGYLKEEQDSPLGFKETYESTNEWAGLEGLLSKRRLPPTVVVHPVDPNARLLKKYFEEYERWIESHPNAELIRTIRVDRKASNQDEVDR